jgi:glycosyltransferase involved in cell wall biosynthesis
MGTYFQRSDQRSRDSPNRRWHNVSAVTCDLEGRSIALVHEWLLINAGSEKTFEELAAALPTADLYALASNPLSSFEFGGRSVTTTVLQRALASRSPSPRHLLAMPVAWKLLRTKPYDVVVTSSHAFSRAFRPAKTALHFSYTYTPARYIWEPELDGERGRRIPAGVYVGFQRLDRSFARSVDEFAAISVEVSDRIRRCYGRDSTVIPPPCDTGFFTPGGSEKRDFLLSISRMVPYKRHDLAIRTAAKIGMRLVIAGGGPDEGRLRSIADSEFPGGVTFVGRPTQDALRELYRSAQALIFPAFEDFGIVPVEAQACGTPVVAFNRGGALDTVVDGMTGVLCQEQTVDCFADGLSRLMTSMPSPEMCVSNAQTFSVDAFHGRINAWLSAGVARNA